MTFGAPDRLLLLWLAPLVAVLLVRAARRRRLDTLTFAEEVMADRLFPPATRRTGWFRILATTAGIALVVLALARPGWGTVTEEAQQRGADVFVLLDVSRSMLADDVRPSRLLRAKADIADLLERLAEDRVGLIAFAGSARVLVPLTTDDDYFRDRLAEADPESVPLGGTALGDAIRRALASLDLTAARDRLLVILTDGEDQESDPQAAADDAAAAGVRIVAIGLGDPVAGAAVPPPGRRSSRGRGTNAPKVSKLDEDTLRQLAEATDGAYVPARTGAYDLGAVFAEQLSRLQRGQYRSQSRERAVERYQWFLAAGLLCLTLPTLRRSARREETP